MYEKRPRKLLKEYKRAIINPNWITFPASGFVLNILKKTYPIREVKKKKLKYPAGINTA